MGRHRIRGPVTDCTGLAIENFTCFSPSVNIWARHRLHGPVADFTGPSLHSQRPRPYGDNYTISNMESCFFRVSCSRQLYSSLDNNTFSSTVADVSPTHLNWSLLRFLHDSPQMRNICKGKLIWHKNERPISCMLKNNRYYIGDYLPSTAPQRQVPSYQIEPTIWEWLR